MNKVKEKHLMFTVKEKKFNNSCAFFIRFFTMIWTSLTLVHALYDLTVAWF